MTEKGLQFDNSLPLSDQTYVKSKEQLQNKAPVENSSNGMTSHLPATKNTGNVETGKADSDSTAYNMKKDEKQDYGEV